LVEGKGVVSAHDAGKLWGDLTPKKWTGKLSGHRVI
jgi:hypothetical protein